jgi:hypothetical protein
MTAPVLTITLLFGTLFMAFLGHFTACYLEYLARKYREDRASIGEAWRSKNDSPEKRSFEQGGH